MLTPSSHLAPLQTCPKSSPNTSSTWRRLPARRRAPAGTLPQRPHRPHGPGHSQRSRRHGTPAHPPPLRRDQPARRHPDDRQGSRHPRRHPGWRGWRRLGARPARLPRRRTRLPAPYLGSGRAGRGDLPAASSSRPTIPSTTPSSSPPRTITPSDAYLLTRRLAPNGHPHYLRPVDYWNLTRAFNYLGQSIRPSIGDPLSSPNSSVRPPPYTTTQIQQQGTTKKEGTSTREARKEEPVTASPQNNSGKNQKLQVKATTPHKYSTHLHLIFKTIPNPPLWHRTSTTECN